MIKIFDSIASIFKNIAGIIGGIFFFFLPGAIFFGIIFAILLLFKTAKTEVDCFFSRCVMVDDRKTTIDQLFLISAACEDFLSNDLGKDALKMSESAWLDQYRKYGASDPLFRSYESLQVLQSSGLKFEREWEKMSFSEIKAACERLSRAFIR